MNGPGRTERPANTHTANRSFWIAMAAWWLACAVAYAVRLLEWSGLVGGSSAK